jgi:formylmethanofuran dehydrogenase subunit A
MEKLIIKNGIVFDPLNKIEGEAKDILIESGKIVEKFSAKKDIKEIDASGKTVIPSALDIHTHIASQQVNWARLLGTNNKKFKEVWKGLILEDIARDYISNGYTFILEANVFPSLSKQTIFNLKQLPVLDKAMLLNVSNFWPLELEFQRGKIDNMSIFLSDLLSLTKGFGFKAYNPFESESWDFKVLRNDLTKNGRLYNFSALNVYENLTKTNENLGLPHSLHAHIEGYETNQAKNNLFIVLDKIKSLNLEPNSNINSKIKRSQIFHLAHASAYNMNGDNEKFIKFLDENQNFDLDLGFIGFDQINPLITSDRRLIDTLLNNNSSENTFKLIRSAVEFEGDSFASLRYFKKTKKFDCILWSNAIDLALSIKDKWQLQLSINFPNYAHINNLPEIATWLTSNKARKDFMVGMNKDFLSNNSLQNHEESLSFNEFVIVSRASPAKSLGLGDIKGNLGVGSDADINILNIDLNKTDIDQEPDIFKRALKNIDYVLKAGKIIKNHEKIDLTSHGKILWAEGKANKEEKTLIMKKKKEFYKKFYSIFYESMETTINDRFLKKIK